MAVNNFLPFATAVGANVESQSDYAADPLVSIGNQSGTTAISAFNNKAMRQANAITSQFAQYMSEKLNQDILDNGDTAALKSQIQALFQSWPGTIDGTLALTGGTLGVATGGLTHLQLSASAGITRNQLNLAAPIVTSDCGNFSTQATVLSPAAVTNLSASITTIGGGPVEVSIQPTASSGVGIMGINIASYNGSSPPQNAFAVFAIKKGAAVICLTEVGLGSYATISLGSGNGVSSFVPSSVVFTDFTVAGTPGTYTYNVVTYVSAPVSMTASSVMGFARLVLREL